MGLITEALNVATALAENGIGNEGLALFESAQRLTIEMCTHSRKLGRWTMVECTTSIISGAPNLHDEQLAIATRRDLTQAFAKIRKFQQAGAFIQATTTSP
jgi:hypothetical protein